MQAHFLYLFVQSVASTLRYADEFKRITKKIFEFHYKL